MSGRPVAEEIAVGGIDVRLIDGDPVADQIAETVGTKLSKGQKIIEIFSLCKPAQTLEPHGIGKMMDGQQRADAQLVHVLQLCAVVRDRRFIDLAAGRHDARPFYAYAGDRQMQPGHQCAVFMPAVPMVIGDCRIGSVLDLTLMIPVVPAAADLPALDLRRSGTDTEQKSLWEL